MSMMVSFVLSFFPRDVLDEILNLIESVSEDFPSYSCISELVFFLILKFVLHTLYCFCGLYVSGFCLFRTYVKNAVF